MEKRAIFTQKALPYLLVGAQMIITIVFFFWPAGEAIYQSVSAEDAFGLSTQFVGLDNYIALFTNDLYIHSIWISTVFAIVVAVLSMSLAMLFANAADQVARGAAIYKLLLVWPYALAPVVAGVLWLLLFNPTVGQIAWILHGLGVDWNTNLSGTDAMIMLIIAAAWRQISYNFLFFLAGLQAIPKSLIEAAAIDGASPFKRFWTIIFPLLSPTSFFLLVVNIVYAFFDTFGLVHALTLGGPAHATELLVYKVYEDGVVGLDLGGSAAESVVLMLIVMVLTAVQFKFVERKVVY